MIGNARCKPFSRKDAQTWNANCTPLIGNAPSLRTANSQRSTERRPISTECKPLIGIDVEGSDRPAGMYSNRAHQHGARNRNRSKESARRMQTADQKFMTVTLVCQPFIRNSKPWSSDCAYRNLSCCMIVAAARDEI